MHYQIQNLHIFENKMDSCEKILSKIDENHLQFYYYLSPKANIVVYV